MTRKRKTPFRPIKRRLATGIVLVFSVVPAALSAYWFYVGVMRPDSRSIAPVVFFQPRRVDQVSARLQPFREAIVTITFDDGWESVYTKGFPALQKYGFKTTQYIIADTMGNASYMSLEQLRQMQTAGTEIGDHTMDHADLTTLNDSQLRYELMNSQQILAQDFHVAVKDFTSPYGAYNAYTLGVIGRYFRSQKNAEGSGNLADGVETSINEADSFNPLNFTSFSIRSTTTLAELQQLLDETRLTNGWLVLTYHQIDNSSTTYAVTPQVFERQIALLSQTPIRSATVGQVIDAYQQEKQ